MDALGWSPQVRRGYAAVVLSPRCSLIWAEEGEDQMTARTYESLASAAARMGVSVKTVRRRNADGVLPVYRPPPDGQAWATRDVAHEPSSLAAAILPAGDKVAHHVQRDLVRLEFGGPRRLKDREFLPGLPLLVRSVELFIGQRRGFLDLSTVGCRAPPSDGGVATERSLGGSAVDAGAAAAGELEHFGFGGHGRVARGGHGQCAVGGAVLDCGL